MKPTFDIILDKLSVANAKLANVHEKLLAVDEELTICKGHGYAVDFSRELVKEALEITQVKEKQTEKQPQRRKPCHSEAKNR